MMQNIFEQTTDPHPTYKKWISFFLILITMAFVFTLTPFVLIDDAYISFRYADNLAKGFGLVFNRGEYVEGITNLLWTLIVAGQDVLFGFPIEPFVLSISLLLIAFSCIRLWQLAPLLGVSPYVGALAAIILLLNPEYMASSTGGLEVPLYSALLVEIVYRYCRDQTLIAYLCSGLLFMTRPEGAIAGLILIYLQYQQYGSLKRVRSGAIIWAGIIVLVTLFRIGYYGSFIPNSIIAKTFNIWLLITFRYSLLKYLAGFIKENLPLIAIFFWTFWRLLRTRPLISLNQRVMIFCVALIVFSFAVVFRNAGDWMPGHRLLTQYAPLYSIALIVLIENSWQPLVIAFLLLIATVVQTLNVIDFSSITLKFDPTLVEYPILATQLKPILRPSDIVSAEAIGYISYQLNQNRIHDPLGLTDTFIAKYGHPSPQFGKENIEYTLGVVKPSVLIWHWAGHLQNAPQHLVDNYELFCKTKCNSWNAFIVMIRKDRVMELSPVFKDWKVVKIKMGHLVPK